MDRLPGAQGDDRLFRFGYPAEVVAVVSRVRAALEDSGLVSVLLVGSAGRGELRYRVVEGRLRIDSDLELYALVHRAFPREVALGRIKLIEAEVARSSPAFHIDVAFLEASKRRLPCTLDLVEARRESVLLTGPDFRDRLPAEPDPRQVVEGTLWQLWELLCALDLRALPHALDRPGVGYALGRCSLHLLTLLLVLEGVDCVRLVDKVRYFSENHRALRARAFFGAQYRAFFQDALAERLGGELSRSPRAVYSQLLEGFDSAVAFCAHTLGVPLADGLVPAGILPPATMRRVLYEAWVAAGRCGEWGMRRSLAWALRRGRGAARARYLAALNRLVLAEATGDQAGARLCRERLRPLVDGIWPGTGAVEPSSAEDYKAAFFHYLTGAYRWYARRYNTAPPASGG